MQEYPDYESQGKTVDELKENLIEIYNDINQGLVPDAEPFQAAVLPRTVLSAVSAENPTSG